MNLEPCDVIFVCRKKDASLSQKIIAAIVKWATSSQFSHVAYFVDSDRLFEANSFRTAGFISLNEYDDFKVKRLIFSLETREKILKEILKTEGKSYGWKEAIALLFRKKFGINVYCDDPDKYICSEELPKAIYNVTKKIITKDISFDVDPQDLWESEYLVEVSS